MELIYKDKVQMKHIKKLRKKLYELKNLEAIEFVHGCGKRKTTGLISIFWTQKVKLFYAALLTNNSHCSGVM